MQSYNLLLATLAFLLHNCFGLPVVQVVGCTVDLSKYSIGTNPWPGCTTPSKSCDPNNVYNGIPRGKNDITVVDEFVYLYRESSCVRADVMACQLVATNITLTATWISNAGENKALVYLKDPKAPNTRTFWTKSTVRCHGHKIRVQAYGKFTAPEQSVQHSASLQCTRMANISKRCKLNSWINPDENH